MNRTMITATNTLGQLQKKMDIISGNISNIQTNGYKRKETYFNDLLVQQLNNQRGDQAPRLTPQGLRQGNGARISQAMITLSQGAIKNTERPLDVALEKEDLFFRVGEGNNIRLTRDGAFFLTPVSDGSNQMMLVTGDGHPVLDDADQPIITDGNIKQVTFAKDGQLRVELDNGGEQVFDLGIVSVQKPQLLERAGDNLLGLPANMAQLGITEQDIMTRLYGARREEISVRQGALEGSNVDLSQEMTDLLTVQRQYQFHARAVTLADQMLGLVNGIR
ncbi:flagellar hook-basal body protein [Peribacillus sp. SCS-155]|uniref:flagellar hook-basal body protein n=1 Tax=Peribacillus sedimenti TaxID=3115297 RepID=UPI0039062ED8